MMLFCRGEKDAAWGRCVINQLKKGKCSDLNQNTLLIEG